MLRPYFLILVSGSIFLAAPRADAYTSVDQYYRKLGHPEMRSSVLEMCSVGRDMNRSKGISFLIGRTQLIAGVLRRDTRNAFEGPEDVGRFFDAMFARMNKVCPEVW
jgi:hypothetical protein